jgi:hypothetical protein
VGVRFVVLLDRDIKTVSRVIEKCPDWVASKDRDYEDERRKKPIEFSYASVHYVVRAAREIVQEGITIPKDTPCEVQVRTLLQHAHSELTHDTVYKPNIEASPEMKRAAAKSMALIEATADFFEIVFDQFVAATQAARTLSDELADLYFQFVGQPAVRTRSEGLVIEMKDHLGGDQIAPRVQKLLQEKPYIADRIRERRDFNLLFRQPSILLAYLFVNDAPSRAREVWPLTPNELAQVFVDLGKRFE